MAQRNSYGPDVTELWPNITELWPKRNSYGPDVTELWPNVTAIVWLSAHARSQLSNHEWMVANF